MMSLQSIAYKKHTQCIQPHSQEECVRQTWRIKRGKQYQTRPFADCPKKTFSLRTFNRMSYGKSKRSLRVSLGPWLDQMSTSLHRSHRAFLRTTMMLRYNPERAPGLIHFHDRYKCTAPLLLNFCADTTLPSSFHFCVFYNLF